MGFLQNMRNKTMINQQVIERLKLKNWYVTCQNEQECNLVLQACDDVGITWASREKTTECYPKHFGTLYESYPFNIGFHNAHCGISVNKNNLYKECELENITNWFFNAIKNQDGKLTPQNAEQEHYVQILLAKMRGIPVEHYAECFNEWWNADNTTINITKKYRIKPEPAPTPLPISRDSWSCIDKKWQYAAMDEDGGIFFYQGKPNRNINCWSSPSAIVDCPLNINTGGINWETSLTERPEDV